MSLVSIDNIPHLGGVMNITPDRICVVHMSPTKMVKLYSQATPNILYAHVINVDDLNTSLPVFENGPQRAFGVPAVSVRGWRVAENRLFVLTGNVLRVMEIDEEDNLSFTNAEQTISTLGLWAYSTGTHSAAADHPTRMDQGVLVSGHSAENNALFLSVRENTASNHVARRYSYNPSTDTFTLGTSITLAHSDTNANSSDSYTHVRFASIPSSTNTLVYVTAVSGYVTQTTTRVSSTPHTIFAGVINTDGAFVRALAGFSTEPVAMANNEAPAPVSAVAALSDTVFMCFMDGRQLKLHTGSSAISPTYSSPTASGALSTAITFDAGGSLMIPTAAVALNETYAVVVLSDAVQATENKHVNLMMLPQNAKVVRIIGDNLAEALPAANSTLGIPLCPDLAPLTKLSDYSLVFSRKTNNTATSADISLRTIHGAS